MIDVPVQYIEVSTDETLAYREIGEGDTFLLLHGNMSSSVHFLPLLEKLKDEYHVIALDLAGFGDSSYHQQKHSLEDFAKDVVSFIELKNLKNIHLVGWSTGGGIALEVGYLLQDKIKQISLLSSVGPQGFKMYDMEHNRIHKREDIAKHPIQVLPILESLEQKNKAFIKAVWDQTIYVNDKPEAKEYDAFLEATFQQRNLVDVDYALVHFNITDEDNGVTKGSGHYQDIKAKILILHGQKDIVVSIEEAKAMKALFNKQATLKIFEAAGHSIINDDLEGLVAALTKT